MQRNAKEACCCSPFINPRTCTVGAGRKLECGVRQDPLWHTIKTSCFHLAAHPPPPCHHTLTTGSSSAAHQGPSTALPSAMVHLHVRTSRAQESGPPSRPARAQRLRPGLTRASPQPQETVDIIKDRDENEKV